MHCDLCGARWMRSKMFRDRSGRLRCPDDADGLDPVSLDRANAEAAQQRQPPSPHDGGPWDNRISTPATGSGYGGVNYIEDDVGSFIIDINGSFVENP